MLLGFASFAELPISTSGPDNSVTISATKNALTISIGNPGITADSIVEDPTGSQVTLGTGTVTVSAGATIAASGNQVVISSGTVSITASANVDPTKASFTLSTGTVSAITWSEIIPGATMTWTAIDEC